MAGVTGITVCVLVVMVLVLLVVRHSKYLHISASHAPAQLNTPAVQLSPPIYEEVMLSKPPSIPLKENVSYA